ncbi:MAG: 50S ribosomal protein L6 [Candidatus Woesearchaeota archaeon]
MMNDIDYKVVLPASVKAEIDGDLIRFTGPQGTVEKRLPTQRIDITLSDTENAVNLASKNPTQMEKKLINTYRAHIRHMVVGVVEGHTYKLKVCSGHFPMKVSLNDGVLEVKNFLGENRPRTLKIKEGADVKIDGDDIAINSPSKELSGQVAADIEQVTRVTNKDRRVFQDGIYITEKSKTKQIESLEFAE